MVVVQAAHRHEILALATDLSPRFRPRATGADYRVRARQGLARLEHPSIALSRSQALSAYMGHSSITVTLDRYGHLMPGNERQAAELLDAYLADHTDRGSW